MTSTSQHTEPGAGQWFRRVLKAVAAGMVAAVAAYASYQHQRDFALGWGADPMSAALWPLSVDGLLIVSTLSMVADTERGRQSHWSTWLGFSFGVVVSLASNIAAAHALTWQSILVAGWPPVALLLVVELLTRGTSGHTRTARPLTDTGSPVGEPPSPTSDPASATVPGATAPSSAAVPVAEPAWMWVPNQVAGSPTLIAETAETAEFASVAADQGEHRPGLAAAEFAEIPQKYLGSSNIPASEVSATVRNRNSTGTGEVAPTATTDSSTAEDRPSVPSHRDAGTPWPEPGGQRDNESRNQVPVDRDTAGVVPGTQPGEAEPSATDLARAAWDAARRRGEVPTGAELAKAGGMSDSLGRRLRRQWIAEDTPDTNDLTEADRHGLHAV